MPHSELYQKILDEAAAQRRPRRSPRAGVAPARVSNAPVRHAPPATAEQVRGASVRVLAELAERDWPNVHYAARPYLDALKTADGDEATFGPARESIKTLVLYFLSNARAWRGPNAQLVKAELRRRFA